jgi:hypothetical protein
MVENYRSIFKTTGARKIPLPKAVTPSILCSWELNTKCGVVLATNWRKRGQHLRTLTTENSGISDGC